MIIIEAQGKGLTYWICTHSSPYRANTDSQLKKKKKKGEKKPQNTSWV